MCNFAIESAQSLRMQGKDLTKGNLMTVMMEFSIPYLCACFLQLLYSMADLYFVGKFCDVPTSTDTTPIFFPLKINLGDFFLVVVGFFLYF